VNMYSESATLVTAAAPAGYIDLATQEALRGKRAGVKALWPFIGPAVIASVGYMDPGNFATNIQAGSRYGYRLLWVVLAANLIAMLFQAMSAKLGIVTGRNLAQLCRQHFSSRVVIGMWIASELAAIATDLAEFLGGAIGLSLLFHLSMLASLVLTGVATCAIVSLDKRGFRPLEIVIIALVAVIGLSYLAELVIVPSDWHAVLYHSVMPELPDHDSVLLSVSIVGATIMPHTLYLHSSLTQQRTVACGDAERRKLLGFSNKEVVVALGVAGAINMAMVVMSSNAFHLSAPATADIASAYRTLGPALGAGAAGLFLVSLIASGVSSSAVGTMAGQVIMQGFVGYRIPVWLRRAITMVPAFVAALYFDPVRSMIFSQVVLSFVLPLPLVALVVLSSRRSVMGEFKTTTSTLLAASLFTVLIIALNAVLLIGLL